MPGPRVSTIQSLPLLSRLRLGKVRKGARLCGNGLEIAVLGDSALGASALESRSLGLWGLGDASVHRWRRSDATGAATAQP